MQSITSELLERLNRNMYGDVPNIPLDAFRKLTELAESDEELVSIVLANWFIFTSFLTGP